MNDDEKEIDLDEDKETNSFTELINDDELSEEEMHELVLQAQREALANPRKSIPQKRVPKWFIWLLSIMLVLSTFAGLFQVFSIPAIDFLLTSSSLSKTDTVSTYKESVVVVVTEDGKGTGFSISSDGIILTNYHVIEDNQSISVVFPEDGRYRATVIDSFPDIDLAVLQVEGNDLPSLPLAQESKADKDDPVLFIGNPLSFKGIVNEGTIIEPIKLNDWNDEVMMIKAPVYRGNSGSPIINEEGQVIGVVFATLDHKIHGKVGLFIPIELYHQHQTHKNE